MAGIYIHIPFCKKACHYCNFNFSTSDNHEELINTIIQEIEFNQKRFNKKNISTIYFGGGTPSLIKDIYLEKIIKKLYLKFQINNKCEITIEANPDDITVKKLKNWKKMGVNRISLGVQSFDDKILKKLNRIHDHKKAIKSIELIKKHFTNYSVDLMFGTPHSSVKTVTEDLKIISSYIPPHISIYNMTLERGTVLYNLIKKNVLTVPNEDIVLKQYDIILKKLRAIGYENYEISNFALKGFRSIHNSNYWTNEEYIGFGPSAHTYDKKFRYWNINRNKEYMELVSQRKQHYEKERLTIKQKINEYILTRIRTKDGLNNNYLNQKFNINFFEEKNDEILSLLEEKLIRKNNIKINLTDKGKKLSDFITEKIMY